MQKILKFKLLYRAKIWWRITTRGIKSVFSFFPFFLSIATLYIVYKAGGIEALANELSNIQNSITAFMFALIFWVPFNMVGALFKVKAEENETGSWHGSRFVYRTPKHIFTALIKPEDNGRYIEFKVPDVSKDVTVQLKYLCAGGIAKVSSGFMEPIHAAAQREHDFSFRVGKRKKARIGAFCPSNSDPTTVRVHMMHWEA